MTRVSIIRLIVAGPAPHGELPEALDYPDAYEARSALFSVIDHAHIVRMDARELSTEEFDLLRNNHYQPPLRRFQWSLLMFWITYLASSAAFLAWLAGSF